MIPDRRLVRRFAGTRSPPSRHSRVEREQHPQRSALGRSQCAHRLVTRTVDAVHDRSTEIRTTFREQIHSIGDGRSLCVGHQSMN